MRYLNYSTPFGPHALPLTESVRAWLRWAKAAGYSRTEALAAVKDGDGFDHGATEEVICLYKGFEAGHEAAELRLKGPRK